MKKPLAFIATVVCSLQLGHSVSQTVLPLWPQGAPGARGQSSNDIPTLTIFLPSLSSTAIAAVVVCPGGGYNHLAMAKEGDAYAAWLNEAGVAAFVLKYRLGSSGYRYPSMLQDAARALRTVRARAAEWHVDPKRIGIMGSSAGGHLASTLMTHFDAGNPESEDPVEKQSSRPDLGILCYPVITMGQLTHKGSQRNLLGENPSPEMIFLLSNELQVSKDTPPCFLWHTWEDSTVPVENTLQFASALRKAGVRFDLHIYERGPHGIGLGASEANPGQRHPWTRDCRNWLRIQGFAN